MLQRRYSHILQSLNIYLCTHFVILNATKINQMKFIQGILASLLLMISLLSCAEKSKTTSPQAEMITVKKSLTNEELVKYHQATFASGCFWCAEGVFESVKGVQEAISGYAGGQTKDPTYEEVGTGKTGHAEAVTVYYDPSNVDYPTLLKVYFASMDPTQVNGQGPDHGTAYRSIIFYRSNDEKKMATDYIEQLNVSGKYSAPIAVEVVPFTAFYDAEVYHQNYIQHNPNNSYVQHESIPRIKRFQKQFPELIKPERLLIR